MAVIYTNENGQYAPDCTARNHLATWKKVEEP